MPEWDGKRWMSSMVIEKARNVKNVRLRTFLQTNATGKAREVTDM
jgi:hypothetical protein